MDKNMRKSKNEPKFVLTLLTKAKTKAFKVNKFSINNCKKIFCLIKTDCHLFEHIT